MISREVDVLHAFSKKKITITVTTASVQLIC